MKKFFYGSLALVFAIATFAFTNPEVIGKRVDIEFYYQAPSGTDFSNNAVKTLGNWTPSSISCNNNNTKACNITVQPAYVNTTPNPDVLYTDPLDGSVLSIATASSSTNVYYVTNTAGVSNIVNKN